MKSVRLIIGLMLTVSGIIFGGESQSFDLTIKVDKSRSIFMDKVSASDLLKYKAFGIGAPAQSDEYYYVNSACFEKTVGPADCFAKIYNIVKKYPSQWLSPEQEQKNYLFPRYIPQSFLEKIEKSRAEDKIFSHILEVKNKKQITFNYLVEYSEKQNETGGEQTNIQVSPVATPSHRDYVVDLLTLLSFIIF